MMTRTRGWMVGLLVGLLATTARADVFNMGPGLTSLEMMPVGNPGNDPDTRYDTPGYGGVSYAYNIGKYEVTAGQYCDFLNAVDPSGTNTLGLYHFAMDSDYRGCQITWNSTLSTYDFSGRPSGTEADWANRPVNFVSWADAARFANWMHNGQPSGEQGLSTTEDGAYYLNGATTDTELQTVARKVDWKWAITSEDEWYKAAYYDPTGYDPDGPSGDPPGAGY
ncbi:MAG: SUMF1/EgtB/PvdO family nonheme iron enzyme [Candidatus Nealsonbacteria bacterium]|nr:SUMF1/EgtB/PvdO family nonheme iron enzyme [Candidatus Nealsonbacteria bacterium]